MLLRRQCCNRNSGEPGQPAIAPGLDRLGLSFEVGLSFSDVPEKLEIPFAAVRGFYDPSVNFELEFDVKTETPAAEVATLPKPEEKPQPAARKSEVKPAKKKAPEPVGEDAKPADGKGADVVSLDAFRKK